MLRIPYRFIIPISISAKTLSLLLQCYTGGYVHVSVHLLNPALFLGVGWMAWCRAESPSRVNLGENGAQRLFLTSLGGVNSISSRSKTCYVKTKAVSFAPTRDLLDRWHLAALSFVGGSWLYMQASLLFRLTYYCPRVTERLIEYNTAGFSAVVGLNWHFIFQSIFKEKNQCEFRF